ncbi:sigma-70 family rna polymerase sigma factor : RNA polymerase sigma factor, sigma-70 family OS=Singulisphaera acidiphila (strain ATCC BAA-1392 / DSM 18658 / VKM B-2454 / MOB10) GN=Sinac_5058 PE=4 SV=1: Sigma70_r2: Sigma70_r4_2: CarboxypepD_reg [Gemmata massiliana]|uniref:ECF RNA polymerase sigma factor SigE n=1 Tax=Gemmata massiliana TaxID=1210884 RepID=A0A6P2CSG6_9BACT|nr:sigma-70 family RNA polymerase sigma factor [Gemmata massiliana]VTR92038.1 sigma-70 family rna polymerase sigma factor : RNA polymerase sigma factor, sigma-70 family OS=Singulisphaera acidiphila (strain ATCC BAA-1392 / DSM 18658 / VKM B-2454 / MOB10) GN=Sinac_5058 PE=4 SV=1: Sigma70_r2: Sigma70_r4_2: CarboxypepD_reg [Gemmata massiliana]
MPAHTLTQIASRLRKEPDSTGTDATDRDLLERFLDAHDEEAFEALVRRHDRLVRSAITKVLPDAHDADDAFQATFLVLVRRAKAIDWRAGLGPWLYGVAHRVAVKARDAGHARTRKEKDAKARTPGAAPDLSWREACVLLHAELDKLPDRYRLPLLLCYLEGKTRDEAAVALKVTVGTVKGRLERGREMLRTRLARRGVALSVGLLAAAAGAPVGASNSSAVTAVLDAVRGSARPRALGLAREVTASSLLSKLTNTIAGVLGLVAVACVLAASSAKSPELDEKDKAPQPAPAARPDAKPAAADVKGNEPRPMVVTVTVKKPDGKPAAGANVSVWAERKQQVTGTTDANGRAELTVPQSFEKIIAVAFAPGFAPDWAELSSKTSPSGAMRSELTLQEDSVALEGRVTDLEGLPVANLPVAIERIGRPKPGKALDDFVRVNQEQRSRGLTSLFDLDSIPAEAVGLPKQVVTDKAGKFKITGIGKDRAARITTRGETTEHLQVRVVTRALEPKLEQHGPFGLHGAKFTLRVGPARPIVGTIRDAKTGAGVPGMKVAELIANICETTTDKDGRFRLVGVRKEIRYMLGTGSLGASPYFDTNLVIEDPPGLGEIPANMKVQRGVIATGRVLDAGGKPVKGSMFYSWARDNPHAKEYLELTDTRISVNISNWHQLSGDGRYKVLVLPGEGALGVCASPEDAFQRLNAQVELAKHKVDPFPGDALHAVVAVNIDPKDPKTLTHDFTLTSGKSRPLVVRGVDGKLPDKLLAVGHTEAPEATQVTGGTLKIAGLSSSRTRAVVFLDEAQTVGAVAAVSGDAKTPVTVTLEKLGSVSGRVFDADGAPGAGADVRVWLVLAREKYDNLPDEVFADRGVFGIHPGAWQRFTGRETKADKDGRFKLKGLLPGQQYRLVVGFHPEKKGGELLHQRADLTVKPGETTDLGDLKPKK